jgi:hypothetical protein
MMTRLITKFKHQTADMINAERLTPNRFLLLITDPWLEKLPVFLRTLTSGIYFSSQTQYFIYSG